MQHASAIMTHLLKPAGPYMCDVMPASQYGRHWVNKACCRLSSVVLGLAVRIQGYLPSIKTRQELQERYLYLQSTAPRHEVTRRQTSSSWIIMCSSASARMCKALLAFGPLHGARRHRHHCSHIVLVRLASNVEISERRSNRKTERDTRQCRNFKSCIL